MADDLTAARELYEEKLGKKPFHGWDLATLEAKIASSSEPLDHDDDGKKGGAKKLPETLDVYLDYDTWVPDAGQPDGFRRIAADHENPQSLPFERAKELLKVGKARRADPLPGE